MSVLLGILLTFSIFLIVVLVHEFGHFIVARLTGIKVLEFGFGIPPKVFRLFRDQKGTEYTMNLLPIGGFVRIKGEDPMSIESLDPDAFSQKPWWARSLVLIAGVTANFLLAVVIFMVAFSYGTTPIAPNFLTEKDYGSIFLPAPEIALHEGYLAHSGIVLTPLSGSIAQSSGILPGDRALTVNGDILQTPEQLIDVIRGGRVFVLSVSGTGGVRELSVQAENQKIGMRIGYNDLHINPAYHVGYGIFESFTKSIHETYALSYMTLDILGSTLKHLIFPSTPEERKIAESMIAGPIGMGAGFVSLVDIGVTWKMIAMIIAIISINLGVFNLLPFPALDGGRLVSTTIRSLLARTSIDPVRFATLESMIHAGGMILLLGLSLLVAYFDISKLL